ncbi:MAG: hypothetical protein Q9185_006220 [Variospora sp. 1 TL-2023]
MPPRPLPPALSSLIPVIPCCRLLLLITTSNTKGASTPHPPPSSTFSRQYSLLPSTAVTHPGSSKTVLLPQERWPRRRRYATNRSSADEAVEEITELYATAKDEFEIATEETAKRSVYAADDRAAAREELEKLKRVYYEAAAVRLRTTGGGDGGGEMGEEVKRRVGARVRELERGVEALEERAKEE